VGLTADLPYMHYPDEPVNKRVLEAMVSHGDANPHFFNYPSLFGSVECPCRWRNRCRGVGSWLVLVYSF
jgi:hypothetical protein